MRVIQKIDEIRNINNWFIIDMGYSNNNKSCGVLMVQNSKYTNEDFKDIAFSELKKEFNSFCNKLKDEKIGLVLEAPLSILFDEDREGNPLGREFEREFGVKKGDKKITATRYWYCGAGATVTLGALEFLNRVMDILIYNNIYLFEGFVSFKKQSNEKRKKEKHFSDAKLLFDGIEYIKENIKCKKEINKKYIFIGNYLKDIKIIGIPPVIKVSQDKKEIFIIKS